LELVADLKHKVPYSTLFLVLVLVGIHFYAPSVEAAFKSNDFKLYALWTAHFVHYDTAHLALNALTLLIAGSVAEMLLGQRLIYAVLVVGLPLISLGMLLLEPMMVEYRGASGLVAAVTIAVVAELDSALPRVWRYVLILGALLAFCVHIFSISIFVLNPLAEVHSAWSSHLMGGVVGLVLRLFVQSTRPSRL
jgi:membrane associated rhomboid family serine protease